jgi:hypothetical protein
VRDFKPEIPVDVEKIVTKMMARKPDDRFATAADVAAALQSHARQTPASFDFSEVLTQRSEEARQRVNLLRQRR